MTSPDPRRRLLIFARYPHPGRVKTRLVPPLSNEAAAGLYRAFLLDMLELVTGAINGVEFYLLVDREEDLEAMRDIVRQVKRGEVVTLGVQRGEGLGARLTNAFADAFSDGVERLCVLGTDHPTLPVSFISDAFEQLAATPLVIGPADDGGYYLIGLDRRCDDIFAEMPWSSPELLAATIRRAAALDLAVHLLPQWYDVDDAASLERMRRDTDLLPPGGRTRRFLAEPGANILISGHDATVHGGRSVEVVLNSGSQIPAGMDRVGIYGGTFDPIHFGHLLAAESALEGLGLDLMLFMPAAIPPHKRDGRSIASPESRLAMLQLAIEPNPRFAISTWEIEQSDVSYTVETVEWFADRNPGVRFTLIIGGDSLADFHTWHRPHDIASRADIAVVRRPGVALPETALPGVPYIAVESPLIEISSSDIRRRIRLGRSVRYRLPDTVIDHIKEHGLYR